MTGSGPVMKSLGTLLHCMMVDGSNLDIITCSVFPGQHGGHGVHLHDQVNDVHGSVAVVHGHDRRCLRSGVQSRLGSRAAQAAPRRFFRRHVP